MEALLAAFLESLTPQALEAGISSAASNAIPADIGGFMQNQVSQQIAPTMDFYKTMTNPEASMGDMANSAFKYSFNPKEDEKALMMPSNNVYGGMQSNYVGGIPSLLQNTNSGLLPYIGSR
jgi:hypothetical protein